VNFAAITIFVASQVFIVVVVVDFVIESVRELFDTPSYASPNIRVIKSRRMEWAEHVAWMEEMRNAYKILVEKPEGKRPLGRSRSRWEDNIRMNVRETGWEGVDWIHLTRDRDK
jgi:hypothetical protein